MRKIFIYVILFLSSSVMANQSVLSLEFFTSKVLSFESKESTPEQRKEVVNAALNELDNNPDFEKREYWLAVFRTFECELKDKGRIIPGCIISHLNEVKSNLESAYKKYPAYYHHAPARTLGIMYFKMPGIVGGSNKKALKFLTEAVEGSPDFKDNQDWLEKVKTP